MHLLFKQSLVITLSICWSAAFSQSQPLDLAQRIFSHDRFPELLRHCTAEYKGVPSGQHLGPGARTSFRLLQQLKKKAVVNMTITDPTGRLGIDTYLFFVHDSIWKMRAFRSLAMSEAYEQILTQLDGMTSKQIDSLIQKENESKGGTIRSRADYDFELGNARLIIAFDDTLIAHFQRNRSQFNKLRDIALSEIRRRKLPANNGNVSVGIMLQASSRKLFISSMHWNDYDVGKSCLTFLIGGILDNTVGYFFVADPKDLPEMNDARLILVRPMGGGWYLYKTT
jgi:hypothetical protein